MSNTQVLHLARWRTIFLIVINLCLWTAFVLAMLWLWNRWLTPGPNGPIHWVGMDFVPYWVGVRNMVSGVSPYSTNTTHLIQSILLGGSPGQGGDPMLFVYPAWIFLVLLPWAMLPLKTAVALWTGSLLFGCLHLIRILSTRWGGGNTGPIAFWASILTLGSLPYLAIAVTKGQLSLVVLGALFLAINLAGKSSEERATRHLFGEQKILHLQKQWILDAAVGIFLAFSILKPTLTVPPVAGILLWAIFKRKGYILAGFVACIGLLFLASWLFVGNWIPDYIQVLLSTGGAPVLWSLAFLKRPWQIIYAILFIGIGIFAFIRFVRANRHAVWFSATILIGLALFPMRWIYDLLLGILVPAEMENLRGSSAVIVGLALIAPWLLAFFPENLRWQAEVIGVPLTWACAWSVLFIFNSNGFLKKAFVNAY